MPEQPLGPRGFSRLDLEPMSHVNRWFHEPQLHSPKQGHEKKVAWLELFYDLIYVAAIIQLGNALSHDVSITGFLAFAGLFTPIWFTWTTFTFYSNRFVVDDFAHRALVFLQMFGVGCVAVTVPQVFAGDVKTFVLSYAGVRLVLVLFYARVWYQVKEARAMTGRYWKGFLIGAILWASTAWLAAPWIYLVWGLALAVEMSTTVGRKARELAGQHPPDVLHMSERYGLLTIIVLGEAFVKVLSAVAEHGPTWNILWMSGLAVVITCSLWWIYFDDVAGSRIRRKRLSAWIWVYTHLPLTIAITALGVGIKKSVFFDPFEVEGLKYRWLLCGTLALALLSVALIDSVTERRDAWLSDRVRVQVRLGSAVVALMLIPAGGGMPSWLFLVLLGGLCLAQVIFDLTMAPMVDPEAMHHEDPRAMLPELANEDDEAQESTSRRRRDLTDTVRIGTPNELRRDFYFFFMEGSWSRFFFLISAVFVFVNVFFAALYLLEPEGVSSLASTSSTENASFLNAFAFSVQTMSTIGYGTMSPTSSFAHVVSIIEAVVGVLGVALVTGLMFAKASRPQASILFSKPIVVARRNGTPTLMFRVGNARGNEVVEASVKVSVLVESVSEEGHQMRLMKDLVLRRDTSPMFTLSWTVMHPLDEHSPLSHLRPEQLEEQLIFVIASLTGHDATYAQTIHARNVYYPEDFQWDACFVDVLETLEDGRLQIDYSHFHDTRPETSD